MTASNGHDGNQSLPPVSSIISLSADHFDSAMFHGQSFHCDESLSSSPSTSMGFREPLRTRQPLQQTNNTDSIATYHHHHHSSGATFENHHPHHQIIKQSSSSPALFNFARKRRSIQVKLDHPQRPFVNATVDRVIHLEDKPLQNLLKNQTDYLPTLKSIKKIQKEISSEFRKNAVIWLEEVCIESKCEVVVFPLTISLMDRFLSKKFVPKMHLQALASACLLLAGKVKAPIPLTAKIIAYYTDGAVNVEQLLEWELAVTGTLGWLFYSPTPFEFFDQILARTPTSNFEDLKRSFQKICYTIFQDETLACQSPSQQAALCLGYAAVETRNDQLILAAQHATSRLLGITYAKFRNGVKAVGKLFNDESCCKISLNIVEKAMALQASSFASLNFPEEGSPRKIKKFDSPPHILIHRSPEPMVISPFVTSSSNAWRTSRIQRSQSTAFYHTYSTSPLSSQEIRKTYSVNSLQRTSFSDDSGFHSEVSSPDLSQSTTMTSPTTTVAGRKIQRARKNRGSQQQQNSSRLFERFS